MLFPSERVNLGMVGDIADGFGFGAKNFKGGGVEAGKKDRLKMGFPLLKKLDHFFHHGLGYLGIRDIAVDGPQNRKRDGFKPKKLRVANGAFNCLADRCARLVLFLFSQENAQKKVFGFEVSPR